MEFHEESLRKNILTIGSNSTVYNIDVANPKRVNIGNYVYIGPHTQLHGAGSITIADYTIISHSVYMLSSIHNYHPKTAKMIPYDEIELLKPIHIGEACWIGARSIIMPGVKLGDGCIVGAGSVVTKGWPNGAILAGIPAKPIGHRNMQHFNTCRTNQQFYMLQKSKRNLEKIEKNAS